MRQVSSLFLIVLSAASFAQMSEDDEVIYQSAIDWLDSKLNYTYYDDVSGKWWKNTFYVNDKKEVTVKHISSNIPNTANLKNKNYSIRTFKLSDINPYTIKITEEEDSKGRIVKGKTLEIRTINAQKSIHKKINNRRGSSTSFLFFSFPEFLNDSTANYAEVVKSKLTEAIVSSTKVYASNNIEESIRKVFQILTGNFKNENDEEWQAEMVFQNTLRINSKVDREIFFGYDMNKKQFYITTISNEGVRIIFYELAESDKLHLIGIDNSSNIIIETSNSFKKDGVDYLRQ